MATATTPSAHSPGPWRYVAQIPEGYSIEAEGRIIAMTSNPTDAYDRTEESDAMEGANARLIAAAPVLLDRSKMSLQDARDALSGAWQPTAEGWQSIIDDLEQLLAAVRGC